MKTHDSQISIIDFFDPHNKEHIKAYKYLQKVGKWPAGFWSDDFYFPVHWQYMLSNKLSNEWVNHVLGE